MATRIAVPLLLLGSSLLAPRAPAIAQVEELPRGGVGVLEAREDRERIEQEKRTREREEERWRPKSLWCSTGPSCAPRDAGIQSERVPGSGLVAVLHDVDVEKSALAVRLRFFNDGAEPLTLTIDPETAYETFFVQVNGERRFILRNGAGSLEAKKAIQRELEPGSMESWWAKFPALPPGAGSFDIVIPPAPPFEAVSIRTD